MYTQFSKERQIELAALLKAGHHSKGVRPAARDGQILRDTGDEEEWLC
jgi:hypothetical protein